VFPAQGPPINELSSHKVQVCVTIKTWTRGAFWLRILVWIRTQGGQWHLDFKGVEVLMGVDGESIIDLASREDPSRRQPCCPGPVTGSFMGPSNGFRDCAMVILMALGSRTLDTPQPRLGVISD